jgi:receptor-type tyrosine-protein phosphatase N
MFSRSIITDYSSLQVRIIKIKEFIIYIYKSFSDGVGRTGTFILLDIVLNRIYKGAREINIAATLEHIRDQRAKMVKTKV